MKIDSALNPLMEELGQLLTQAGQEDASGSRRYLSAALVRDDRETVARMLRITDQDAASLRQRLVAKYGDPDVSQNEP